MLIKHIVGIYRGTGAVAIVLIILAGASFFVFTSEEKARETTVKQTETLEIGDPYASEGSAVGSASNVFTAQLTNCTVDENEVNMTNNERQMLSLINSYRQANGLSPYSLSKNLSVAAAWHSHDMAVRQVMNHTDSLGRIPSVRIGDCGYTASGTRGENIAFSTRANDPNQIFTGWKNSPGHNANMLKSTYVVIGIAEWRMNGRSYWTTDFGGSSDGTWDGGTAIEPTNEPTPTDAITNPPATETPAVTQPVQATTTPEPTPEPVVLSPSEVGINIKLRLPGIGTEDTPGQNPIPVRSNITAEIEVYDLTGSKIKTVSGTLYKTQIPISNPSASTAILSINAYGGDINLGDLENGNYQLKIRIANSLWKNIGLTTLTKETFKIVPHTDIVTGDIDQNNSLGLEDYNVIINCYGTRNCSEKEKTDLNIDGKVDEKDLNIFYSGLAKRQGD